MKAIISRSAAAMAVALLSIPVLVTGCDEEKTVSTKETKTTTTPAPAAAPAAPTESTTSTTTTTEKHE